MPKKQINKRGARGGKEERRLAPAPKFTRGEFQKPGMRKGTDYKDPA